ncbi:MAG: hypothetical protein ABI807_10385 [Sporichthyaceae bacterium]
MTAYDDPLLGGGLPPDEPAGTARLADDLRALADRLGVQGDRVAGLAGASGWCGVASAAADRRLGLCRLVLRLERDRLHLAADALGAFSRRVALAQAAADEARRLIAAARAAQDRADLLEPAAARSRDAGAMGHRLDGSLYAPEAVLLLDRARERALAARTGYDDAASALAGELTSLTGRELLRQYADRRFGLDLLALVPVVGSLVTVGDGLHYAATGEWDDVAMTVASAVPGPVGWTVTAYGLTTSLARMGDVVGVARSTPAVPVVSVPAAVSAGASAPVVAPGCSSGTPAGRRRRTPPPPSPPPP